METASQTQPTNGVDDTPADLPMDIEEPQPSTSTTVAECNEKDTTTEAEWQKPISLKALKKKLNELFVAKYVSGVPLTLLTIYSIFRSFKLCLLAPCPEIDVRSVH